MLNSNTKPQKIPPLIKEGVFLSAFTTMKIGGSARYFAEIERTEDIAGAYDFAQTNGLNVFILGGGSNTVFADHGHDGLVMQNKVKGIELLEEDNESATIKVFAGENWDSVVQYCVNKNLGGVENLTAIPGTLGGAIVQNIGAYGEEIKKVVVSVLVFDPKDRQFKSLDNSDLHFGYRHSLFKEKDGKDLFIVSAELVLRKNPEINISYKDLANFFSGQKATIGIKDVREALEEIRSRKFPDLKQVGTAGSFFKNCIVSEEVLNKLKAKYPEIPFFKAENKMFKISSAWILDKICGLRGLKEGSLGLYENQSLVVVNFENATSKELKNFISKIKSKVFNETGLNFEEEVIVL